MPIRTMMGHIFTSDKATPAAIAHASPRFFRFAIRCSRCAAAFARRQDPTSLSPCQNHRRRVLKVPDSTKPLFVAQVTYKGGRFSWARSCLLVVTADAVCVLDAQSQGELEARDGSHASMQLAVRASEVVDVVLVAGGLRLEYKSPGALKV